MVKNIYFILYNNPLFLFFSIHFSFHSIIFFIECPKAPQLRQCFLCLLSIISTKRSCHSIEALSHVHRGEWNASQIEKES